jgi:hypothetical protein
MTALTTATAADSDTLWSVLVDDAPVSLSAAAGLIAVGGAEGTAWILDTATGHVQPPRPRYPAACCTSPCPPTARTWP